MAVSGKSRWKKVDGKFWDYRPFTRIVQSLKAFLNLRDYIRINQIEGAGFTKDHARLLFKNPQWLLRPPLQIGAWAISFFSARCYVSGSL